MLKGMIVNGLYNSLNLTLLESKVCQHKSIGFQFGRVKFIGKIKHS